MVGAALAGVVGHAAPAAARSRAVRLGLAPGLAGRSTNAHVALTFDDGPDPVGTPVIAAALATLGWRATFFCLGSQAQRHPRVVAALARAGHEIAVHGYTHRSHLLRSPSDVHADLRRARDVLGDITGVAPEWFRPPYGVLTGGSVWAARTLGLRPVLWTAWGRDWLARTPRQVADTVLTNLRAGGTVLLHDSGAATDAWRPWRSTASALPMLAAVAGAHEWTVGPLGEHGLRRT